MLLAGPGSSNPFARSEPNRAHPKENCSGCRWRTREESRPWRTTVLSSEERHDIDSLLDALVPERLFWMKSPNYNTYQVDLCLDHGYGEADRDTMLAEHRERVCRLRAALNRELKTTT